jgi:hypothetical protein
MIWKKLLSVFKRSLTYFAAFMLASLMRSSHLSRQDFILSALFAALVASCGVGFDELKRGEHRKARRLLIGSFLAWIAIIFALLALLKFSKATQFDFVIPYLLYSFFLPLAAPFPVALCLNRNEPKRELQQTKINAS